MFYPQFLLQPYPHVGETGVESFKGRTGVITPATDDYTAGQITETADRLFLSANERQRVAGLDVASIAALKDITVAAVPDKMQAIVGGYYAHGDGGGGIFYYDAAETADDNGGTIIAPNSGSGRWKRAASLPNDARWFGTANAETIVSAMGAIGRKSVTLRELLGSTYSSSTDASEALSAFLAELAPAGVTITDPDAMTVLLEAPLPLIAGARFNLHPQTTFLRGFAGAAALIGDYDMTAKVSGWHINGGIFKAASSSQKGMIMGLYGDNWSLTNVNVGEYYVDAGYACMGILFGGDNNRISNTRIITPETSTGSGAFRMICGKNFVGSHLYAECGDDLFQFVPIGNPTHARYNESISDSVFVGCSGKSAGARVCAAGIDSQNTDHTMTATIKRCGWVGVSGAGGARSLMIRNVDGDGTVPDQINDIYLLGCSFDASQDGASFDNSAEIISDIVDGIGNVNLHAVTISGTKTKYGLALEGACDMSVSLSDCHFEGEQTAFRIGRAKRVTMRGGHYVTKDNGGGHTASHVVTIGTGELVIEGEPIFSGVATSMAAIRANNAAAVLYAPNIRVEKATGATGVLAFSHVSSSQLRIDRVIGTYDTYDSGSGIIAGTQRVGTGANLTIASGSVTLTHANHNIDTEAAAASDDLDTVVFPDWAKQGQMFTIRALNTARTVVIKNGTGNIVCGADFSLDSNLDVFVGVKIGSSLFKVSASDLGT